MSVREKRKGTGRGAAEARRTGTGTATHVVPSHAKDDRHATDAPEGDSVEAAAVPTSPALDELRPAPSAVEDDHTTDVVHPAEGAATPLALTADAWADDAEAHPATLPTGDVSRSHLKGLIEALVFVSDHPVPLQDVSRSAGGADRKLLRTLVDELRQEYRARGIHLDEVAGGLLFRTNPAYGPFIRDAAAKKPVKMTRAQLEALAIIAYRQPLTRPEVDDIRGVDSGPVIKMLLDRDLVRILGKKDEPGRPLLYGTTAVFLEFFGLKSLKDLPSLREFTELSEDSRKVFEREMSDVEAGALPRAETLAAFATAVGDDATGVQGEHEGDPVSDAPTSFPATQTLDDDPPTTSRPTEALDVDPPTTSRPTQTLDDDPPTTSEPMETRDTYPSATSHPTETLHRDAAAPAPPMDTLDAVPGAVDHVDPDELDSPAV